MSLTLSNSMGTQNNFLHLLKEWEEDLLNRYTAPGSIVNEGEATEKYRNYQTSTKNPVKNFYRLNYVNQIYDFVLQRKEKFLKFEQEEMSVWDAFEFLNKLVDNSDPDIDLAQLQHLLETPQAIRADAHPDWIVFTGLVY